MHYAVNDFFFYRNKDLVFNFMSENGTAGSGLYGML